MRVKSITLLFKIDSGGKLEAHFRVGSFHARTSFEYVMRSMIRRVILWVQSSAKFGFLCASERWGGGDRTNCAVHICAKEWRVKLFQHKGRLRYWQEGRGGPSQRND